MVVKSGPEFITEAFVDSQTHARQSRLAKVVFVNASSEQTADERRLYGLTTSVLEAVRDAAYQGWHEDSLICRSKNSQGAIHFKRAPNWLSQQLIALAVPEGDRAQVTLDDDAVDPLAELMQEDPESLGEIIPVVLEKQRQFR